MMVSVDLFGQCTDSNRTNNVAVFPVRLSVNETRGKKEINLGYKIMRVLRFFSTAEIYNKKYFPCHTFS